VHLQILSGANVLSRGWQVNDGEERWAEKGCECGGTLREGLK